MYVLLFVKFFAIEESRKGKRIATLLLVSTTAMGANQLQSGCINPAKNG